MIRRILATVLTLATLTGSAFAEQPVSNQLLQTVTNSVKALGQDPAPLGRMSSAQLASLYAYIHSSRRSSGDVNTHVAYQLARANGERSFLRDLFLNN